MILEPRPAARYLSLMLGAFNARNAEEGRSFMSGKRARATRLGEKVFGDNFTLRSEIGNPILRQTPDRAGRPRRRPVTWVEKGVVKNLFYDRFWAQQQKKEPTAHHARHEPGDGRRHDDRRGDDQDDQARLAGHLLLVHPRRRQP